MKMEQRLDRLESKVMRIERLLWYVAGALSLNLGKELLPIVSAMLN